MKKIISIIIVSIMILSALTASAEKFKGDYTKTIPHENYSTTTRAFYSLAVVDAKNGLGAYIYDVPVKSYKNYSEYKNDPTKYEDKTTFEAFLYNGCIVQCIEPPSDDGWITIEVPTILASMRVEDLSFKIPEEIEHQMGFFINNAKVFERPNEYEEMRFPFYQTYIEEPCHVLGLVPGYGYSKHHLFYFVETKTAHGFVNFNSLITIPK